MLFEAPKETFYMDTERIAKPLVIGNTIKNMVVDSETLSQLLISATRYALGRQTYITAQTPAVISAAMPLHSPTVCRQSIISDINNAKDLRRGEDKSEWLRLACYLDSLNWPTARQGTSGCRSEKKRVKKGKRPTPGE